MLACESSLILIAALIKNTKQKFCSDKSITNYECRNEIRRGGKEYIGAE